MFFCRFYADDVVLRLYSAGEHLARAIIDMLKIQEGELSPYKTKSRISRQTVLGHFLQEERPDHPITVAVLKLANSTEWQATRKYRDDWVHGQPGPVRGLGIVYRRHRRRWQISDDGKHRELHFGGADEPEYSIEDILAFIQPALSGLVKTCDSVVQFYLDILKNAE